MHLDMLEELTNHSRGRRKGWAAPRGHAKSTIVTMSKNIHKVCYKKISTSHFIGIVSEIEPMAIVRLKEIKAELEENMRLRAVYGDLVGNKTWLKKEVITSNGIMIKAYGAGSKMRGDRNKQWRLTDLAYDDVENRKSVKSAEQRAEQKDWFEKDTLKAGIPGYTNFEIVGTVLDDDSLLQNLIKNPGWDIRVYRAVIDWPKDEAKLLWDQWTEILVDLHRPNREDDADAFYARHKDRMLVGVKVLWPSRIPFVELMKMLVFEGRAAFETELQNNPFNPETALFQFDDAARFRVDWERDLIIRRDGRFAKLSKTRRYSYHDPAYGETADGDFGCIVGGAVDEFGYLYVTNAYIKREPTSKQIQAGFEQGAIWTPRAHGLETNSGWKLLGNDYADEANRRAKMDPPEFSDLPLEQVFNTDNKQVRIAALEPKIANKWILFNEQLPEEFTAQMRKYPTHGYDDGPDALEGLVKVARRFEPNLFGGMDREREKRKAA